jgi:phospholipid:diacylglycerol acyltransferase
MASLRHRGADNSRPSKKREESPPNAEEVRLAPVSKIITDTKKPPTRKRRNGLIFFLGGIFGLLAAGFFAQRSDLLDFPELSELSMESLIEVLPAGFVSDARDLAVCSLHSKAFQKH